MDDLDATRQPWFLSLQGDGTPTIHPLGEGRTVLGRDATADLRHPAGDVSGQHAAILLDRDGVRIEDLNSTNGTYVNGEQVRARWLAPGDVVRLGSAVLRIDTPDTLGTLSSPTAFSVGRQGADAIWNVGGNVHQSSYHSTHVTQEEWHPWDELFNGPLTARLAIVGGLGATLVGFGLWMAFIFSMWDSAPGFGEQPPTGGPFDDIPRVLGLPMPIVGFALFGGGALVQGIAIYWSRAVRKRRGEDVGVMPRHSAARRRRSAW